MEVSVEHCRMTRKMGSRVEGLRFGKRLRRREGSTGAGGGVKRAGTEEEASRKEDCIKGPGGQMC